MVYFFIVALIIILDQVTKNYIVTNLDVEEIRETKCPKLLLWHRKNYGMAYSSFTKFNKEILSINKIFVFIWSLILLVMCPLKGVRLLKTSIAMTLGGGIGNLIDRIRNKCVTDFIYIKGKRTPIFNVADIFIVIGTIIGIATALRDKD